MMKNEETDSEFYNENAWFGVLSGERSCWVFRGLNLGHTPFTLAVYCGLFTMFRM